MSVQNSNEFLFSEEMLLKEDNEQAGKYQYMSGSSASKEKGNPSENGHKYARGGGYATGDGLKEEIRVLGNARKLKNDDTQEEEENADELPVDLNDFPYFPFGAGSELEHEEFSLSFPTAYVALKNYNHFDCVIAENKERPYESAIFVTIEKVPLLRKISDGDFVRMQLAGAVHANRELREVYFEDAVVTLAVDKLTTLPIVYRVVILPKNFNRYYQMNISFKKAYKNMRQVVNRFIKSFRAK